jgi:hypothetical protein
MYVYIYLFIYIGGTEFELRASQLQSRCVTSGAIPPVHFADYFGVEGSHELFAQGWLRAMILLISAS